jgi:hypothetical protein
VFTGPAGVARAVSFAVAGAGLLTAVATAAAAGAKGAQADRLAGSLTQQAGRGGCGQGGTAAPADCAQLLSLRTQHDNLAVAAIASVVAAGVVGTGATVSIWLPALRSGAAPGRSVGISAGGTW